MKYSHWLLLSVSLCVIAVLSVFTLDISPSQAQVIFRPQVVIGAPPVVVAAPPPPPQPYCTPFVQTMNIGGEVQQTTGTACLQPNGAWEMIPAAGGMSFMMSGGHIFFRPAVAFRAGRPFHDRDHHYYH